MLQAGTASLFKLMTDRQLLTTLGLFYFENFTLCWTFTSGEHEALLKHATFSSGQYKLTSVTVSGDKHIQQIGHGWKSVQGARNLLWHCIVEESGGPFLPRIFFAESVLLKGRD